MTIRWNPEALDEVFALPAQVVDRHIRLAGSAQLKVLLWLARAGRGTFDADACAAAIACRRRTVPMRCSTGWKPACSPAAEKRPIRRQKRRKRRLSRKRRHPCRRQRLCPRRCLPRVRARLSRR